MLLLILLSIIGLGHAAISREAMRDICAQRFVWGVCWLNEKSLCTMDRDKCFFSGGDWEYIDSSKYIREPTPEEQLHLVLATIGAFLIAIIVNLCKIYREKND
jgi:hypothetical protein